MSFTEEYKKSLELRMLGTIIAGLEQNQLHVDELHVLANAILQRIDHVKTHDELIVLLQDLTQRWPIFQSILEAEQLYQHMHNK